MVDVMAKLAELREANGGIIEAKAAQEQGVPNSELSRLCTEGKLVRVGRGRFAIPKDREDELVELAYDRKLAFSHQTALHLHGLLDDAGARPAVTVPKDAQPDPQLAACDLHFAPAESFELGRTLATTELGNLVPAYDLERSVCDIALARDDVGLDLFLTVITRYAQDSRCDAKKLYEYGDILGATPILHDYLDVLLWAQKEE